MLLGIKLVELESVGGVLDPDVLEVYPLFENGAIDFGNAVSLYDVTDEWFESLSDKDKQLMIDNDLEDFIK